MSCLEVFLGGMASGTGRRSSQLASHLAVTPRRICLPRLATYLPQDDHRLGSLSLPRPPIGHNEPTWYRNINLLAIGYAFRPRLRSRLTLSRRTLLRKPWTIGGGESHPTFVTHAGILTSSRSTEAYASASRSWNALLPRTEPAGLHTHSFGD